MHRPLIAHGLCLLLLATPGVAVVDPALGVFLQQQTLLGKPDVLEKAVISHQAIDRYFKFSDPSVRRALNDEAVLKGFLGRPDYVETVLATPALQNARTVAILVRSPLAGRVLKGKAVKTLVADRAFVAQFFAAPAVKAWLANNPDAQIGLVEDKILGPVVASVVDALLPDLR